MTNVIPMATIGGSRYMLGNEPRCKVCRSPYRMDIETMILEARGYTMICRLLPPEATDGERGINPGNISAHIQARHSPILVTKVAVATAARSVALGKSIEEYEETMIDRVLLGQQIMNSYFAALVSGKVIPSGSDALGAMKMFAEIDAEANGSMDVNVYNQVFSVIMATFKSEFPDRFDDAVLRIQNHPVVSALLMEMRRKEAIEASTS